MIFAKLYERDGQQILVDVRYPNNEEWADDELQIFYTHSMDGVIHRHFTKTKSKPYPQENHLQIVMDKFALVTEESAFAYVDDIRKSQKESGDSRLLCLA